MVLSWVGHCFVVVGALACQVCVTALSLAGFFKTVPLWVGHGSVMGGLLFVVVGTLLCQVCVTALSWVGFFYKQSPYGWDMALSWVGHCFVVG